MPSSRPEIIDLSQADRSLRWTGRPSASTPLHMPLAVSVKEKIYLITDFDSNSQYAILLPADKGGTDSLQNGLAGVLTLSAETYGAESLCLSEWAKLYEIACIHNSDICKLPMPQQVAKIPEQFRAVIAAVFDWPEDLVKYLDAKPVPWRTLYLLTLSDAVYAAGFTKTNPSVQSFRQFTETQRDFSLSGEYSVEHFNTCTERRSPAHVQADTLLAELNDIVSPVSVQNRDSFETPRLHFTFSIDGTESFHHILEKLTGADDKIKALYDFMKENGLK